MNIHMNWTSGLRPGTAKNDFPGTDLCELVSQMPLGRLLPPGVLMCADLPTHPCSAAIETRRIREILVDLVLNARAAVGREGVVHIGIDRVVSPPAQGRPALTWIQIEVSDSGPRLAPAAAALLFDPSFSEVGQGLGLSGAALLVAQSGGSMKLVGDASDGNTVRVRIPAFPALPALSA